jgi:predicted deacylase
MSILCWHIDGLKPESHLKVLYDPFHGTERIWLMKAGIEEAQGMADERSLETERHFDWNQYERGTKGSSSLTFRVHPDTDLTLPVLQITGEKEGPSLLVFASIHGDEYEGIDTILRLYNQLSPQDVIGRLVMLPTANPLAYRGGTRISPDDDVNLARAFPGNPEGSITQQLAYVLHHQFIAHADFLLDLHSGGTHYAVATMVGYYHDEHSELGQRSRAAAIAFGMDLLWAHSTIAAGRSISSAQSLGIPWLYTEAYGGRRIRQQDSDSFYTGSLRLMNHLKMLVAPDQWELGKSPASIQTIYGDGNFDASVVSEAEGFFIPRVKLMSEVHLGDLIGTIYALSGESLQEVRAYADGFLVMMVGTPIIKRGEPIYLLAALHE